MRSKAYISEFKGRPRAEISGGSGELFSKDTKVGVGGEAPLDGREDKLTSPGVVPPGFVFSGKESNRRERILSPTKLFGDLGSFVLRDGIDNAPGIANLGELERASQLLGGRPALGMQRGQQDGAALEDRAAMAPQEPALSGSECRPPIPNLCCPSIHKKNDWPYFISGSTFLASAALTTYELLATEISDSTRNALGWTSLSSGLLCWLTWDISTLRKAIEDARRIEKPGYYYAVSAAQSQIQLLSCVAATTRMCMVAYEALDGDSDSFTSGSGSGLDALLDTVPETVDWQTLVDISHRIYTTGAAGSTLLLPVLWRLANKEGIPLAEREDSTTFMPHRFMGLALTIAMQIQAWQAPQDLDSVSAVGTASSENALALDYICSSLALLSAFCMMYYSITRTDWTCSRASEDEPAGNGSPRYSVEDEQGP